MTQPQGKAQQTQTRALGLGKGACEFLGAGSMKPADQSQVHRAWVCLHPFLFAQSMQVWASTPVTCSISWLQLRTMSDQGVAFNVQVVGSPRRVICSEAVQPCTGSTPRMQHAYACGTGLSVDRSNMKRLHQLPCVSCRAACSRASGPCANCTAGVRRRPDGCRAPAASQPQRRSRIRAGAQQRRLGC